MLFLVSLFFFAHHHLSETTLCVRACAKSTTNKIAPFFSSRAHRHSQESSNKTQQSFSNLRRHVRSAHHHPKRTPQRKRERLSIGEITLLSTPSSPSYLSLSLTLSARVARFCCLLLSVDKRIISAQIPAFGIY